ncbi:MAG: hypothetical protein AAGF11_16295 [Myxococcota bacterium]
MNDYSSKPFRPSDLREAIVRYGQWAQRSVPAGLPRAGAHGRVWAPVDRSLFVRVREVLGEVLGTDDDGALREFVG